MGRFATTVHLYEQFRPPYPLKFFRQIAEHLALTKQHALIDLGTGPGLLALGFADYAGRVVAVDPEPAMLAAARRAVRDAGRDVELVERRAEDLPDDIGRFDLVTIGRALHWLDEAALGPLPCVRRSLPRMVEMPGSRNSTPRAAPGQTRGSGPRPDQDIAFIASLLRCWSRPHLRPPR